MLFPGDTMKSFRTIFARDMDSVSLKSEMETYGYVFIRDLMGKGDLEQLLGDMIGIASDEGWTIEGSAPSDRIANPAMACFDPEPKYKQAANRAFRLERLHVCGHLLGESVLRLEILHDTRIAPLAQPGI